MTCRVAFFFFWSLSARRAWIEITRRTYQQGEKLVALRKESVDRNSFYPQQWHLAQHVALRKESVDRNRTVQIIVVIMDGRSPQGERG